MQIVVELFARNLSRMEAVGMNLVSFFRVLIVASAISYFLYFFMPYFPSAYSGYEDIIAYDGTGPILIDWNAYIFDLLFFLWAIASIGMLFLQNWGRYLFLVLTLVSFIFDVTTGVSITIPSESFLVHLIATLDGVIIAMAFLSPISVYFGNTRDCSAKDDL